METHERLSKYRHGEKMSFESDLDELFNTSECIEDTIWYSPHETLRDAIMRIYEDNNENMQR